MRDPYQSLGVQRGASAADIKQAYRRLAKLYHPDLNPGRSDIEQRFKEISAAYSLLSDPTKRARFDRGEIDASGSERPRYRYERASRRAGRRRGPEEPFQQSGFGDDWFSDLFGGRRGDGTGAETGAGSRERAGGVGGQTGAKARGSDINYSVTVPFLDAALGTRRRIDLSNGKSLEVVIPPGTQDQQKLRLKGQGMNGRNGGAAGDALVEVMVEAHTYFTRENEDIHVEVPVSLPEAVLGAIIRVPTLTGNVALKVPPGSNTGSVLRLKGKGIIDPRRKVAGDQYVKLRVVLPEPPDSELAEFLEKWARKRSYDVRRKLGIS